jgi:hypothetical protein
MEFTFERGSAEAPKGHALVYFRGAQNQDECWATYIVVLPILVDVSKYVPPFLMNQMGDIGPKDLSAFAFPPAPEQVSGHDYVQRLATIRGDDIIYGGTMNPTDISSALMVINEAIAWYAQAYAENTETDTEQEALETGEEAPGFGVNEVLYELMGDSDKLGELTRLVGRLTDAVDTQDEKLVKETQDEISILAKHLPENHDIPRLTQAARAGGDRGSKLAGLYLQRCFHLIAEEYVKLGQVEDEIQSLEAGAS